MNRPVFMLLLVLSLFSNFAFGMYDAEMGRWLTQDPLGVTPNPQKPNTFKATDQYKDGLNVYQYVGSDPVMNRDSHGLMPGISTPPGVGPGQTPGYGAGTGCMISRSRVGRCHSMLVDTVALFRLNEGGIEINDEWITLPGGVKNDRFAHCYISCRLRQECGYFTAWAVGIAREAIQVFSNREDSLEDEAANLWGLGTAQSTPCCANDDTKRRLCLSGCETAFGDPEDQWLP